MENRNRATTFGGQPMMWDASGNVAQRANGDSLAYDTAGRLVKLTHADGSSDEFVYDALGRRIQ